MKFVDKERRLDPCHELSSASQLASGEEVILNYALPLPTTTQRGKKGRTIFERKQISGRRIELQLDAEKPNVPSSDNIVTQEFAHDS